MSEPAVTILIPNCKTPELTRICLRQLNRCTPSAAIRVIVIDNDSGDESLDYLRSLSWIKLIERHDIAGESGAQMHAKALDLALAAVDTEFVLAIHTDTLVIRPDWLDYLLGEIRADNRIAGVGSWKLEHVSFWKRLGKKIEKIIRTMLGLSTGRPDRYLRSHCALYRTELLRNFTHGFSDGDTAGRSAHHLLEDRGYILKFLPAEELGKYIRHLNHATGILLHPEGARKTCRPAAGCRLQRELAFFREVLNDSSLDQPR